MAAKGMLPFETHSLAKIPVRTPYMKRLLDQRWKLLVDSRKRGETQREFDRKIRNLYIINGWTKKLKNGVIRADPWKMLRSFEDEYKKKKPEFKSEDMKRPPSVRRNLRKLLNR